MDPNNSTPAPKRTVPNQSTGADAEDAQSGQRTEGRKSLRSSLTPKNPDPKARSDSSSSSNSRAKQTRSPGSGSQRSYSTYSSYSRSNSSKSRSTSGKANSANGSGRDLGQRRQTIVRINELPSAVSADSYPRRQTLLPPQKDGNYQESTYRRESYYGNSRPSMIPPRQSQIQSKPKNPKKQSSSEEDSDSDSDDSSEDDMSKNRFKMMKMQQQQAAYYNYCCQQQGGCCNTKVCPEQLCMTPMQSAAFVPPNIDLMADGRRPSPPPCFNAGGNEDELEDGVAFSYKPRPTGRTEFTITVEPKKQPWLNMMRFGFRPVINCSAPPCYLSPSNSHGLQFQSGGQPGMGNNPYPHYHSAMHHGHPFWNKSQEQDSEESSSSEESSTSEDSEESDDNNNKGKISKKKNQELKKVPARKSKITKPVKTEETEFDVEETVVRNSIAVMVSKMEKNEDKESLPSLHSKSGSGSIE